MVFDPGVTAFEVLPKIFPGSHDRTQGMRKGNDQGTQHRSGLYVHGEELRKKAESSKEAFQKGLSTAGCPPPATAPSPSRF